MIREKEFRTINFEVLNAIEEAFDFGKKNEKDKNDFYLFLCNAGKVENTEMNPYVIDYNIDNLIDNDRLYFLEQYLKSHYSFPFASYNTSDSKVSLTMEMMMYTHIWESKNFLKQLKKLRDLCDGKEYSWTSKIPDSNFNSDESKQDFIRKNNSRWI